MACLKAPIPPIPTFPTGVGFGVVTPAVSLDIALCCKTPPWPYPLPPIPLSVGVAIPPPLLAFVASVKKMLIAGADKLQIDCPRD